MTDIYTRVRGAPLEARIPLVVRNKIRQLMGSNLDHNRAVPAWMRNMNQAQIVLREPRESEERRRRRLASQHR